MTTPTQPAPTPLTPDELIERYCDLYERANGKPLLTRMAYRHGWFVYCHDNIVLDRVRKSQLLARMSILQERVVVSGGGSGGNE